METSAAGRAFIANNEWKPKSKVCGWDEKKQLYLPYKDYKGFWTLGIGHLIVGNEDFSAGRTEQQVDELFARDLKKYERAVLENVTVPLTQNEFDALVDFCFNEGVGAVSPLKNSAIKALNLGHRELVPRLLLPWDVTAGVHDKGLRNRRIAEGKLFMQAEPGLEKTQPVLIPEPIPLIPAPPPIVAITPPVNLSWFSKLFAFIVKLF